MKGMKSNIKVVLGAIFLLFSISSWAQSEDFRTRYGLSVSGELIKKLDWVLEFEQRYENNATQIDRSLLQASAKYELIDNLKLGGGYRLAYIYHYNDNNEFKQRFYLDLSYSHKIARLKPSYRCRWQYGGDDIFSDSGAEQLLRQRLKIEYNLFGLPFTPYLAAEIFSEMDHTHQSVIQAYRYIAGAEFKLSKSIDIDCSYFRDTEINRTDPGIVNALSLSVSYQF